MKYIIFLLLFCFCPIYSQNISVDYKFTIIDDKDNLGIIGASIDRLVTNSYESMSYAKSIDTTISYNSGKEFHIQNATNFNVYSYFKYMDGFYLEKTLFPKYNLKDQSYSIEWKLEEGEKNILGYKCSKASGYYRGREYVAYYTIEIPIQSGPNRFCMLPGLILEVYSTDQVVKYKAISVTKTDEKIYNFLQDSKEQLISWEEFVELYKIYYDRMINYKPDEFTSYSVPNRSVEIYFDK